MLDNLEASVFSRAAVGVSSCCCWRLRQQWFANPIRHNLTKIVFGKMFSAMIVGGDANKCWNLTKLSSGKGLVQRLLGGCQQMLEFWKKSFSYNHCWRGRQQMQVTPTNAEVKTFSFRTPQLFSVSHPVAWRHASIFGQQLL